MSEPDGEDWSLAGNPYTIAVSEAGWWLRTVQLTVRRLEADDEEFLPYSSRQIDARTLVLALNQLLVAEQLEQAALSALDMDSAVGGRLADARQTFLDVVPGLVETRNRLVHFNEWSRGAGHNPQKSRARAGEALRDVASSYWRFRYDPPAKSVLAGPHEFDVADAEKAAGRLAAAIYEAARQVDQRRDAHG